jgi:hypothetical protein
MRLLILFFAALSLFAQAPQPTVRVKVTPDKGPVHAAEVNPNGQTVRTGRDGVATAPVPVGSLRVTVSKEGFSPRRLRSTLTPRGNGS